MSRIKEVYRTAVPVRMRNWVRRNILPYDTEEIHIERIVKTHSRLFKWIRKHSETMLMPAFSAKEPSAEEFQLYEELVSTFRNPIGLHVHISNGLYHSPPLPLQDFETQYEIVNEGLKALRKLGVFTTDFTSGNWNYSLDTFLVCIKLNLTKVHIKLREIPKITVKCGVPKGVEIIPVTRHVHDYDI